MASYTKTVWQDSPNQTTPVSASNLNKLENAMEAIYNMIYPVGSIYMSVNSANPSTLFGGTWVAWGSGRVPVGVDSNDSLFDTVEETGGNKTHTLTENELKQHSHPLNASYGLSGWGLQQGSGGYSDFIMLAGSETAAHNMNSGNTGENTSFSIMQPYITCYMWKRTS